MAHKENSGQYTFVFDPALDRVLHKLEKRKPSLFLELTKHIERIVQTPSIGKPLRNVLRNYRRIHVGSFVLIYEIKDTKIRFLDFGHHDRIYKKHSL